MSGFFGPPNSMQMFLGQGMNPSHSSEPKSGSDNVQSLTTRLPGNFLSSVSKVAGGYVRSATWAVNHI